MGALEQRLANSRMPSPRSWLLLASRKVMEPLALTSAASASKPAFPMVVS